MNTDKLPVSSWFMLVLSIGLLAGCGATGESSPALPTPITSPTSSVTPTPLPIVTPVPSATPRSPQPQAELVLVVQDCLRGFCIPSELERQVRRAVEKPGILDVATVGEYHVRLVYDPTRLTAKEATELFEQATNFEVEPTR